MAGRIVYLEIDDEITSAAARIRDSASSRIAVVLPYGSRVATSRINFRLLARDALTHEKRVSIVSTDPATRALAASAGLAVFGSVAEYESSGAGDEEAQPDTSVPVVPVDPVGPVVSAAPPPPRRSPAVATSIGGHPTDTIRSSVPRELPTPYDRRPAEPMPKSGGRSGRATAARGTAIGGIRTSWLIGGAILALAILVGGVGVYLLLPSATIVVTPRPERIAPVVLSVVADTAATQPDPGRGIVPAKMIPIPVSASNTFSATGKRVALSKATGTVRFENLDPTSTNRIAAGSVVRTDAGVQFRTQVTITVPSAELVGLTIFPAHASVKVAAIDGGPDANVDAGTITHVPDAENSFFLKVTNPEATTGGTSQEFPRVTQLDVDAALAALNVSLQQAFNAAIADPGLATDGARVFPATGTLAEPTPDVPPDTLVGQEVATFVLSLSAAGTVIAVDAAPVSAIADTQLRGAVKSGYELVPGSEDITVGQALVVGQSVSFPVTASARQIAILDAAALKAAVLGKSIEDARAILAASGEVSILVSPDWAGSVPGFESRVTLTIAHAVQIETPGPSGTTPTTRPTPPATLVPGDVPTDAASGSGTP